MILLQLWVEFGKEETHQSLSRWASIEQLQVWQEGQQAFLHFCGYTHWILQETGLLSRSRVIKESVFFCVTTKTEVFILFPFHSSSSENEAVFGAFHNFSSLLLPLSQLFGNMSLPSNSEWAYIRKPCKHWINHALFHVCCTQHFQLHCCGWFVYPVFFYSSSRGTSVRCSQYEL